MKVIYGYLKNRWNTDEGLFFYPYPLGTAGIRFNMDDDNDIVYENKRELGLSNTDNSISGNIVFKVSYQEDNNGQINLADPATRIEKMEGKTYVGKYSKDGEDMYFHPEYEDGKRIIDLNLDNIKLAGLTDRYNVRTDRFRNNESNLNAVGEEKYFKIKCDICYFTQSGELRIYYSDPNTEILELTENEQRFYDLVESDEIQQELDKLVESDDRLIVFNGAPGTGKTYSIRKWMRENNCIDIKRRNEGDTEDVWQFVQFHPSYDYTDFVEGLRPVMISSGQEEKPIFVRIDGVFKSFCREAAKDGNEHKKFFFVIDEINRADIGKVFGELMFGLEESYRGKENAFDTQYMNLPTYMEDDNCDDNGRIFKKIEEDSFKDGFFISKNVYIIGTMNDIDRSVDSLDFAMRRRFKWVEITVDKVMESALIGMILYEIGKRGDPDYAKLSAGDNNIFGDENSLINVLKERMEELNKIIESEEGRSLGLGKDYCIGPAYLKGFAKYAAGLEEPFDQNDDSFKKLVDEVWLNKIKQILINYCRGRNKDAQNEFIEKCRKAFVVPEE